MDGLAMTEAGDKLAYSVDAAAALIGLGRSKLYLEVASGRLRVCKVGSRTIIRRADLIAYLDLLAEEAGR
jgi:excisionase family DNA binding protein